jgi:hypothetical protein
METENFDFSIETSLINNYNGQDSNLHTQAIIAV